MWFGSLRSNAFTSGNFENLTRVSVDYEPMTPSVPKESSLTRPITRPSLLVHGMVSGGPLNTREVARGTDRQEWKLWQGPT